MKVRYFGRSKNDDRRFASVYFKEDEDRLFITLCKVLPAEWGMEGLYLGISWCNDERVASMEIMDHVEYCDFMRAYKEAKSVAKEWLDEHKENISV